MSFCRCADFRLRIWMRRKQTARASDRCICTTRQSRAHRVRIRLDRQSTGKCSLNARCANRARVHDDLGFDEPSAGRFHGADGQARRRLGPLRTRRIARIQRPRARRGVRAKARRRISGSSGRCRNHRRRRSLRRRAQRADRRRARPRRAHRVASSRRRKSFRDSPSDARTLSWARPSLVAKC